MNIPENMILYEALRTPPKEACKAIEAGRLKGFTDINPMWRIKSLTEQFGPCGFGWYVETDEQWTHADAGETAVFIKLSLYVKRDGEWSKPIIGYGGSRLVAAERMGARLDDEGYKKAFSDALGSAHKMLGGAADIYWAKDSTKYTSYPDTPPAPQKPAPAPQKPAPAPQQIKQAPVQITKSAKVPSDKVGEAEQIARRSTIIKGFMERHGLNAIALAAYRNGLVEAGQIKDIPTKNMTTSEFEETMEIFEDNWPGGEAG